MDENETFTVEQVNTDGIWIGHEVISHIAFQIGEDDEYSEEQEC